MVSTLIKSNLEEYERLFLSLGDKTRLKLLTLMANEPVSVGFLVDELGESQPKVSRHLAYLRNSGVVNTRREGKSIYYGIQESDDPDIDRITKFVIGTMSGEPPVEFSAALKSRQVRTAEDVPVDKSRKAKVAKIGKHDEREQLSEPETESVDYEYMYQEEEVGESFAEIETNDNELEVFLL